MVTASVVATRPAAIEMSMVLNTAAGPYVSHAAHSAAMRMMAARMCMAYRHSPPVHDTGCVVFNGSFELEPECCNEIATDVTRIAAPMAFCCGVSEQAVNDSVSRAAKIFMGLS